MNGTCSVHELNLYSFLTWVIIFWLFTDYPIYYTDFLYYSFIFNMNFKFCEQRIDICVVTFCQEKILVWNHWIYFTVWIYTVFYTSNIQLITAIYIINNISSTVWLLLRLNFIWLYEKPCTKMFNFHKCYLWKTIRYHHN